MVERRKAIKFDPQAVYDQFPDGIGEVPSDKTPGQIVVDVLGLKNEGQFLSHLNNGIPQEKIRELHANGKKIGATWSFNTVHLFVGHQIEEIGHLVTEKQKELKEHGKELAEQVEYFVEGHKKELMVVGGIIMVAGGTVYLLDRFKKGNKIQQVEKSDK